ncbi:P-loop containing nucleoside triphosphate hydrolase protein [Daldinia loculata]|uniref:P-loop containing nucleoside triphosphate hydrolase protein n=1 Tax=Daldinia loculata TaxID=103429 RepID=UPI0020C401E6|nr:P-loop containing nucleoside triphosphate hydrolase protein [Daldinia loculata]KAI1645909.1 P-loop containing nucleoside triphosphate hydrolase protein [Daldinia loculata]
MYALIETITASLLWIARGRNLQLSSAQTDAKVAKLERQVKRIRLRLDKYDKKFQREDQKIKDMKTSKQEIAAPQQTFGETERQDNNKHTNIIQISSEIEAETIQLKSKEEELVGLRQELGQVIVELEKLRKQESLHQEALQREQKDFSVKLQGVKNTLNNDIQCLTNKLRVEEKRKHLLFQQVQTLQGTVRVICRIRPDTSGQLLEYTTETGYFYDHATKLIIVQEEALQYEFERIFLPKDTNDDIFNGISHFVKSVLDGKKACIFCYGQSGTGKTYTMSNLDNVGNRKDDVDYENDGIIPRVKTMIFSEKKRLRELGTELVVSARCFEIYDENLWLIRADGSKEKPRAVSSIVNSEFQTLDSAKDFSALVNTGMKNRHFGATALNKSSSRSHFIISLKIVTKIDGGHGKPREGLFSLVDLAGFERTEQAETMGKAFKEGNDINLSLMALRSTLDALAKNRPLKFRDSILTMVLQPFLGEDSMTLMFVMISLLKDNWQATKWTLELAKIARVAKKRNRDSERAAAAAAAGRRKPNVPASTAQLRRGRK